MTILAQTNPVFQPAMRIISAITNTNPAAVTTTFDHQYATGMIVRLDVPLGYGMQQVNQLVGTIAVTGSDTFTIDIDTTAFDVFAAPVSPEQYPQCVPLGELAETVYFATRNILP